MKPAGFRDKIFVVKKCLMVPVPPYRYLLSVPVCEISGRIQFRFCGETFRIRPDPYRNTRYRYVSDNIASVSPGPVPVLGLSFLLLLLLIICIAGTGT